MEKKLIAIIVLSIIVILFLAAFLLFLIIFNKKAQYKNRIVSILEKNNETTFLDLVKELNDNQIYVINFISKYFFFFQDLYFNYEIVGYFDNPNELKFVKKNKE